MKKDNFDGISPEMRALLLPMAAQIEALQRKLDNTIAVKDAEIAHLKEVIATYHWSAGKRIVPRFWNSIGRL